MKRIPFSHVQAQMMDRNRRQRTEMTRTGQVVRRSPSGPGGSSYSVSIDGGIGTDIASMAGDYAPGDTVAVHNFGPGAWTQSIMGAVPTNKRATQAAQAFSVDVTGKVLR